jgi:hypothetical protein
VSGRKPAIIARIVDLPQPDGQKGDEFAVGDLQGKIFYNPTVIVDLSDFLQGQLAGHRLSSHGPKGEASNKMTLNQKTKNDHRDGRDGAHRRLDAI